MRKKILKLFMMLLFLFILGGCGSKETMENCSFGEGQGLSNPDISWKDLRANSNVKKEADYHFVDFGGQSEAFAVNGRFEAVIEFDIADISDGAVFLSISQPDKEGFYIFYDINGTYEIYDEHPGEQAYYSRTTYPFKKAPQASHYIFKVFSNNGKGITVETYGDWLKLGSEYFDRDVPVENAQIRLCGSNVELQNITYTAKNDQKAPNTSFGFKVFLFLVKLIIVIVLECILYYIIDHIEEWICLKNRSDLPFRFIKTAKFNTAIFVICLALFFIIWPRRNDINQLDILMNRLSYRIDFSLGHLPASAYMPICYGAAAVCILIYVIALVRTKVKNLIFMTAALLLHGILCALSYGLVAAFLLQTAGPLVIPLFLGYVVMTILGKFDTGRYHYRGDFYTGAEGSNGSGSVSFPSRLMPRDLSGNEIRFVSSSDSDRATYTDDDGNYYDILCEDGEYVSTDGDRYF